MNEAEYLMKNCGDQGGCYPSRRITPSEISIILHTIRKLNSVIVLLFIQNNSQFKNIAKTSLPASMLSLSSIVYVQVCPAPLIFSKQQMSHSELSSCCFCSCFQPLFCLVPAVLLTRETSEVSTILVFTTETTQSDRPQVFSVNGALTCRDTKFFQILSSVTGYGEFCMCFQPIRIGDLNE